MIFENFHKKIEKLIIKENKYISYKRFCAIFSEHYPFYQVKNEHFLDFINNIKPLEKELKIVTVLNNEFSKLCLEFNDFYIVYEERNNNKGRLLNYYIFKSDVNDNVTAKLYCSTLNNNEPIVTFETKEGNLLFHYDVNDNFCFIKTFVPVSEQYSYAVEHFSDNDVNEYLLLNYDFKSDSLINVLIKINKILN